jgi:hypothetical protein
MLLGWSITGKRNDAVLIVRRRRRQWIELEDATCSSEREGSFRRAAPPQYGAVTNTVRRHTAEEDSLHLRHPGRCMSRSPPHSPRAVGQHMNGTTRFRYCATHPQPASSERVVRVSMRGGREALLRAKRSSFNTHLGRGEQKACSKRTRVIWLSVRAAQLCEVVCRATSSR